MITNFYFKIPKQFRLLILFIVVVFFVLFIYFFLRFSAVEPKNIPGNFLMARQEASVIASEIVSLSNESTNNLNEIARLDKEKKYTEALLLVSRELERNRQAREKAIKLSVYLETMAKNLNQISPASASQLALQAISSETGLISRLITYNDYLTQLLEVLREKFLGKNIGNKIPELIAKINDEAQAINDLNQKFNEVMREFDSK